MDFKYKGKKILINTLSCNYFEMGRGLMFRSRKNAHALMFDFKKHSREILHSMFVFFPFVAIWFDKNKIVGVKLIKPFRHFFRPQKSFTRIVEIPCNPRYHNQIKLLVGDQKSL